MPGVQPDRHRTAGAHARDSARGTLDIGGVDIAARHDDDVLDPAADHDVAVLHQIAEVAGVIPAVFVLSGDEPAHRDVAGGHRFTSQLDHPDTAGRQHIAV